MIDMVWEVREREVIRMTLRFLVCINRVESDAFTMGHYILKDHQVCWDDNHVYLGYVDFEVL